MKTTPLSGEPDLLKGPSPEGEPADPDRRRSPCTAASSASSPQSRHKTPQQVDQIAQGRVWDGGTAHQLGLVDGFGGMSDAIAKAAELAKLGNERGVRYLEPQPSFRDQLIDALADGDNDDRRRPPTRSRCWRARPEQRLAAAIAEVRSILAGPSIQARCLECPAVAPARVDQRDLTLLGLVKEWLR